MPTNVYRSGDSQRASQTYEDRRWREQVAKLPIRFSRTPPTEVRPGYRLEEKDVAVYKVLVPEGYGRVPDIYTVRAEKFLGQWRYSVQPGQNWQVSEFKRAADGKATFHFLDEHYELNLRNHELHLNGFLSEVTEPSHHTEYAEVPEFMRPRETVHRVLQTEKADEADRLAVRRSERAQRNGAASSWSSASRQPRWDSQLHDPGPPPAGYGSGISYEGIEQPSGVTATTAVAPDADGPGRARLSVARIRETWNVPSSHPPIIRRELDGKTWMGFQQADGKVQWVPPTVRPGVWERVGWSWNLDGTNYEITADHPTVLHIRDQGTLSGATLKFQPETALAPPAPSHGGLKVNNEPEKPATWPPPRPTDVSAGSRLRDKYLDRLVLAGREAKARGERYFSTQHLFHGLNPISQPDYYQQVIPALESDR